MDAQVARRTLESLALEAATIAQPLDVAVESGDLAEVNRLLPRMMDLLSQMAEIRCALGEGPELFDFICQMARKYGIDFSEALGLPTGAN